MPFRGAGAESLPPSSAPAYEYNGLPKRPHVPFAGLDRPARPSHQRLLSQKGWARPDPPQKPVSGPDVVEVEVAVAHAGQECRPLPGREAKDGPIRVLGVAYRNFVADGGCLHARPRIAMPAPLPGRR